MRRRSISFPTLFGLCLVLASGCDQAGENSVSVHPGALTRLTGYGSIYGGFFHGDWSLVIPNGKLGMKLVGDRFSLWSDYDYPVEIGMELLYSCTTDNRGPGTPEFSFPATSSINPLVGGQIVSPHSTMLVPRLPCIPMITDSSVEVRPVIPTGAVPFHDAYQQTGDFTNFFPAQQMRLNPTITIARADTFFVGDSTTHQLNIRYSNSHPGRPPAQVVVLVMNADTAAVVQSLGTVPFYVTPDNPTSYDQWDVVSRLITTPASVQNVYIRLQLQSSDIVYLDAAWLSP